MVWLPWRRKRISDTAQTFVEATGGGWYDSPDVIAADGGNQSDYVDTVLRGARDYAQNHGIEVGQSFDFTMTDIPMGITSPHEISFGIIVRASEYGLSANFVFDESVHFTRTA